MRTRVHASRMRHNAGDASNRNPNVPSLNDPVQDARVGHNALSGFDHDGPGRCSPRVPVGGQRKWLEVGIHRFQRVPSKGVCLGALARRKAAYGQTQDIHAPCFGVGAERALIPTVWIAVVSRRSRNCCQPCSTFQGTATGSIVALSSFGSGIATSSWVSLATAIGVLLCLAAVGEYVVDRPVGHDDGVGA